jgi:hypothetical protein
VVEREVPAVDVDVGEANAMFEDAEVDDDEDDDGDEYEGVSQAL